MSHPRPDLRYILVDDATGDVVSTQNLPHGGPNMLPIPSGHTEYEPNEASFEGYEGECALSYNEATNNVTFDALGAHKERAKTSVDRVTESRILADRFEYPADSGKEFTLTLNAQVKWNGIINAINAGVLDASVTPITVKTHDDGDEHTFNANADIINAWAAGYTVVQGRLAANRAAKDDVDSAADEAAVDAVVATFAAAP